MAQQLVVELEPPAGTPYPPERVADVIGHPLTFDVQVGGRPFRMAGTVQDAELLESGNLRLTVQLQAPPLN
jgi:hypothetical protein